MDDNNSAWKWDARLAMNQHMAKAMLGTGDWNWRDAGGWAGEFGISETRARDLESRRGGHAFKTIEPPQSFIDWKNKKEGQQ